MIVGLHHIPDIVVLLAAFGLQTFVFDRVFSASQRQKPPVRWFSTGSRAGLAAGLIWAVAGTLGVGFPTFGIKEMTTWWALSLIGAAVLGRIFPPISDNPGRRAFLSSTTRAAVAAPLIITGIGSMIRKDFQVVEVNAYIHGLPAAFDGFRILQLTDIHLGPLLERKDLRTVVAMANELLPDLAVVTGDLITSKGDPLDGALAELAALRAAQGIYGCHGNHEIYSGAEDYASAMGARLGIRFLRSAAARIESGSSFINLVGVDYQRINSPYLENTEKLTSPGNVNVLLSHNPDVFPVARKKGFALTLAGHTHGGQVNVEILDHSLNVARFMTPYTKGLYTEENSSVYVSAGIGTVGIPVRLGAPPEVSVVKLCAT